MARETCELIMTLSNQASHPVSATEHISYQDAFLRTSGVDPFTASAQELREATLHFSPTFDPPDEQKAGSIQDRRIWLDLLAGTTVYPSLTGNKLWVIDRFPADQAMLARLDPDDSRVAERFEVILDGVELANGFRELRDATEQAERFALDCKRRAREGGQAVLPDSKLLAALEAGLPDCAGVAVGLDRLVLATNRLPELAAAISFVPGR
jgi:lysyl-tRNA synthetase class 2